MRVTGLLTNREKVIESLSFQKTELQIFFDRFSFLTSQDFTDIQFQMKQKKQETSQNFLSPQDQRVLDFIRSFQIREGLCPTRQEIATGMSLGSLMAAQRSVQRLKKSGKIDFDLQSKRGLRLIEKEEPKLKIVELPLLGTVAAGEPIEAIESFEPIQVPATLIRGPLPHFVLRVKGNSMIEDHICNGDYVVIRQQSTAQNGEKVVALINNEATLKHFYQKQGRIELHPANQKMNPIILEPHQHLRIAGVLTGLIRVSKS